MQGPSGLDSLTWPILQSSQRKGEVKDCVAEYGHADQDGIFTTRRPSVSKQTARQVKAKFIVGLTATPTRKDGHHPIIFCRAIRSDST